MLENKDMEDPAVSQEQPNIVVPQPQLEQANQSLVAQTGAQEYAPHVINTPPVIPDQERAEHQHLR